MRMDIKKVSLRDYTSLHIGGEADMVVITHKDELKEMCHIAGTLGKKMHCLGEGTNTFFGDALDGLLIVKIDIQGIEFNKFGEDMFVTAGAGVIWDTLVKKTVEQGLWGLENLSLIPGTVGASPFQNIGAYGVELSNIFVSLTAFNIESQAHVILTRQDCLFGYRDSLFKQRKDLYIITSVTLLLSHTKNPILTYKPLDSLIGNDTLTPLYIRDFVIETRLSKLPDYKIIPNAGSFFKNPFVTKVKGDTLLLRFPALPLFPYAHGYKIPAAWLIEHVALMKGVRVGDVGTWPHQPLVLVNYGKGTWKDLLDFSETIIEKIHRETDVIIEREVVFVT